MRIAMLSWESLHSIAVGGVAAHVSELAAALAKAGHEVEVFTRMGPDQPEHQVIDGVVYHRCPYAGSPDFIDDVNSMCRAFVDAVFAAEDHAARPFDVIHAHDWLAANAMIWIKAGRDRFGVQTIHSTEYGRSGNVFHDGASERVRGQERAGVERADRVIAVSGVTRDEVEWMYEVPAGKTAVVHNGVNPERFADAPADLGAIKQRYAIGPMDPTVLFCGRLVWQKGPDLLVEAVPALLQEHPRAKVVFAGDGQMRGKLEHRARKMGVGDAVRFLGHRSGPELVELFQMSQLVAVPSRNEPFGIVVLEGWSAGKPVVATHVGGPSEYLRHEVDGLKVYPNPESVAWGLREAFRDFDRAEAMGAEGRRSVEREFRWERIAEQTLEVYDPDRTLRGPAEIEVEPESVETTPESVAPAAEPTAEPEPLPVPHETAEPEPEPATPAEPEAAEEADQPVAAEASDAALPVGAADEIEVSEAEAPAVSAAAERLGEAAQHANGGNGQHTPLIEMPGSGIAGGAVGAGGGGGAAHAGRGSNGSGSNGNGSGSAGSEPGQQADRATETAASANGNGFHLDEPASQDERIAVAAELSVERSNGNGASLGEALAVCERALSGRGWRVQRQGTQMRIEGDLEPVLGALQRCHRQVHRLGTLRLKTAIHTLQIQPPGNNGNGHSQGNGHGNRKRRGKGKGKSKGKASSNGSARKKSKTTPTVA